MSQPDPASDPPIFSSLASDADLLPLVEEFVTALETRMASLEAAFEADNLAELARLAHQLKGAGGGYGFDVISTAAAALEAAAQTAGSPSEVRNEMDTLIALCHRASADPAR